LKVLRGDFFVFARSLVLSARVNLLTLVTLWSGLILVASPSWAVDAAKIIRATPSKKNLVLNIGEYDAVRAGDRYFFFGMPEAFQKQGRDLPTPYVGLGVCVKTYVNYSLWHMRELSNKPKVIADLIQTGKVLGFAPRELLLRSMGKVDVDVGTLVFTPMRLKAMRQGELISPRGNPIRMSILGDNFELEKNVLVKKENHPLYGAYTIATWKQGRGQFRNDQGLNMHEYFVKILTEKKDAKRIQADFNEKRLDQLLINFLEQADQGGWDVDKFLAENVKEQDLRKYERGVDWNDEKTVGEHFLEMEETKRQRRQRWDRIMQINPYWSQYMSDEELKKHVIDLDLQEDEKRRISYMREGAGHDFFFSLKRELLFLRKDYEEENFSYLLGYEYYLLQLSEFWEKFSLKLSGEKTNEHFVQQGQDMFVSGNTFLLSAIYYWEASPDKLKTWLPYVGAGLRYGKMDARILETGEAKTYYTSSLPSLMVGLKYRYGRHWGMYGEFQAERLELHLSRNDFASANLDQNMNLTRTTVSLGMSYVF
jgi:hypothetical protein